MLDKIKNTFREETTPLSEEEELSLLEAILEEEIQDFSFKKDLILFKKLHQNYSAFIKADNFALIIYFKKGAFKRNIALQKTTAALTRIHIRKELDKVYSARKDTQFIKGDDSL